MRAIFVVVAFFCCMPSGSGQNCPVVVELFTSQGCSSCPAADRNLSEIITNAEREGKPVYGLSFHVDYWNHNGWTDPYSNKAFTARQGEYARIMGLASMYTPQMIINGTVELVGSDKSKSASAIQLAMKEPGLCKIQIANLELTDSDLRFEYLVDKLPKGAVINAAIVERGIENYVSRGENSGKKLHHDNVVRMFVSQPARNSQRIDINLSGINRNKLSLIVYIQDLSFRVLAATAISLKG